MGIYLRGFREWHRQMEAIAGTVGSQKAMRAAARYAVKPVVETAQELVPVGGQDDPHPGVLKASIKLVTKAPKAGLVVASAGLQVVSRKVKLDVEDADGQAVTLKRGGAGWRYHLAEFGSRHKAARPFIRPAWDRRKAEIVPRLAWALRKQLAKAIKRGHAVWERVA